ASACRWAWESTSRMAGMLRLVRPAPGAGSNDLRYGLSMLPGLRHRLTMPKFAAMLALAAVILAAVAVSPVAADSAVSPVHRAHGQVSSGRTIIVDGFEIGIPDAGVGVG